MIVDAYRAFNRNFSPSRGDIDSYTKVRNILLIKIGS